MSNILYYGDNLTVLREQIADESVDLVYLDPPFHPEDGQGALLNIRAATRPRRSGGSGALHDGWWWDEQAACAYEDVIHSRHLEAATILKALRVVLGQSTIMASLAMMTVRLIELRRVLKPSGSLYLHTNPVSCHYLKVLADAVFGQRMFRTEIVWDAHDGSGLAEKNWPRPHKTMLSYVKSSDFTFHPQFRDQDGKTKPAISIWNDIDGLNHSNAEATQRPIALLDRIISTSSNKGDVVLDLFCGTGTALHAAQRLNRRWIGTDVTSLAISLASRRLKDAFPGTRFEVHGTPQTISAAQDLALRDERQFQWWAVSLVDAVPLGRGKDGMGCGIDGVRWLRMKPNECHFEKILVSATGQNYVEAAMLRSLKGEIEREKALSGLFITLIEPTQEMQREAAEAEWVEADSSRHPKIQILTIADLLAGTKPNLPRHTLAS